jgi:hypothetical protein
VQTGQLCQLQQRLLFIRLCKLHTQRQLLQLLHVWNAQGCW